MAHTTRNSAATMRNPLSEKVVGIKPSGIRKFFDIVNEMDDVISLSKSLSPLGCYSYLNQCRHFLDGSLLPVDHRMIAADDALALKRRHLIYNIDLLKLSTLDTILSTATHFILKKYKDHGTILTRKYEDTREKVTP